MLSSSGSPKRERGECALHPASFRSTLTRSRPDTRRSRSGLPEHPMPRLADRHADAKTAGHGLPTKIPDGPKRFFGDFRGLKRPVRGTRRFGRVPRWKHSHRITPVCLASMTPGGWSLSTPRSRIDESRSGCRTSVLACSAPNAARPAASPHHADERRWRHLDTMQFTTELVARLPRSRCPEHGVKTIVPPWAGKHSRFTLLFEAFAIEVLQACRTVNAAAALLSPTWASMRRASRGGMTTSPFSLISTVPVFLTWSRNAPRRLLRPSSRR